MRTDEDEEIKDENDVVVTVIKKNKPIVPMLKDRIAPVEKKKTTKEQTVGFRVSIEDKELLEKFSRMVNNTGTGAFCKKLLYDKYNSTGSTAATILEMLEDFESLSKDEVIKLVKAKEAEVLAAEETVRDINVKRVHRDLIERADLNEHFASTGKMTSTTSKVKCFHDCVLDENSNAASKFKSKAGAIIDVSLPSDTFRSKKKYNVWFEEL